MRGVWGPSFCGKCKRALNGQAENRESLTLPRRFLIPQANPPIIEFLKRFVKESRLCLTFNTIYARPFQNAGTKRSLSAKKNVFHGFDRTNKGRQIFRLRAAS